MYLRVSITDRCNLRCRYCLPDQARFAAERASTAELLRLTELLRAEARIHKIRITGGEPTLSDDLIEHVRHARALLGPDAVVGMTSNGVLLEPLLPALHDAGLNRLNISLDATNADAFTRIARRSGFEQVIGAIRAAKRIGFTPLKINAVAMAETDYAGLARFAIDEGIHLRFIELMAIGEARPFHEQAFVPAEAMRQRMHDGGIALSERTDRDEPTSRIWAIDGVPLDHASVGFITTSTQPFCATCDRLRLSSQGKLYTCLMDDQGHDLLTPLRRGDTWAVRERIRTAVAGKKPPAAFVRSTVMAEIGG